ncbi:MAG: glycoside hydrolase, partial [Candidatus Eremiobacteraeota bacterium]|nr:glycoside hydrolase [Candidatus Eremiobacteraeota bacterium]
MMRRVLRSVTILGALGGLMGVAPSLYADMHWRFVGPLRGGRTTSITGVPGHPNTFYIGVVNGGVWKTDDAGRTWTPIFDAEPTGSVGAVAVARSNPNVIYVGSGEGLQRPDLAVGDGIYKSSDGGASWTHFGLRDGQQISGIAVDPRNADRLFVAVLGHPYGPNDERGVYRSTDGGRTFARVLSKNPDVGAFAVAIDPHDSNVVYATLWAARQAPWEIGGSFEIAGSGIFKSSDGGTTWQPLTQGLPQQIGRAEIAPAPSDPSVVYVYADTQAQGGAVYRSSDGGAHFTKTNDAANIAQRGADLVSLAVDPHNAAVVYLTNTSTYRSSDGGKTFIAIKGAPGGDDYHSVWIDPDDSNVVALAADQGATISVNGGRTWSSWYNQPTAQMFHVSADDRFPYWICGGQQESGSACVSSRGNWGAVTERDWHTAGAQEYGYVIP